MCEFAYMKLYPGDFLADTLDLNRADLGSYMLLLMAMWRQGGELPSDPKGLARICRVRRDWPKTWERLKRFFIVSEDGKTISQKRLTRELEAARKKQDKYAETRAQRAQNAPVDAQQNVHSKSRKPLNDNDPPPQRARAFHHRHRAPEENPSGFLEDAPRVHAHAHEARETPLEGRSRSLADCTSDDFDPWPKWLIAMRANRSDEEWLSIVVRYQNSGKLPEGVAA